MQFTVDVPMRRKEVLLALENTIAEGRAAFPNEDKVRVTVGAEFLRVLTSADIVDLLIRHDIYIEVGKGGDW